MSVPSTSDVPALEPGAVTGSDFGPSLSCVVLFDIDGTLLTGPIPSPSPGVVAMAKCVAAHQGHEDLAKSVEFAGRTDSQIARDLLMASGHVAPGMPLIQRFLDMYLGLLRTHVIDRPYRPLSGVREAIEALRARRAVIGLGTGNIRRGAEAKLESAGLADLFDFDKGGYGDDAIERDEVLRTGARRCDPDGRLALIIVGDTPYDVRAAHAIGGRCIAVTTGSFDEAALRTCGADATVPFLDATLVRVVSELMSQ